MKFGDNIKYFNDLQKDGIKVSGFDEKPIVPPELDQYLVAYSKLQPSKTYGEHLRLSEIAAYIKLFPTVDIELFVYLIQALDYTVVSDEVKKQKNKIEAMKNARR